MFAHNVIITSELGQMKDLKFFLIMNSPEGSSYKNTVQQMLRLEEKLLEFNKSNEALI